MAYLARAMEQHPADSYTCGYRKGEKDQYVCAKEDNSTATLWLVRGIDTRAKGSSLTVYKIKIGFINISAVRSYKVLLKRNDGDCAQNIMKRRHL